MILNKKGLSQVVTTVLIILIVLAAVVIIWAFIRPTITQAGEQITADCITLDLQVLSCNTDTVASNTTVQVKRNAGTGDLRGIRLIYNEIGNTNTLTSDGASINELESKTYNINGVSASQVNVAPLIGDNQRACNPQYTPVSCAVV